MSDPRQRPAGTTAAESSEEYTTRTGTYPQPTGYAVDERQAQYRETGGGMGAGTLLAGMLMILSGIVGFLDGFAKVTKAGFYHFNGVYPYHWTIHGWGWLQLIGGAVIFAAGCCVLFGMVWARVVGVILATLYAVAFFLTLPFYPVWSIVLIALNVFIIWSLVSRDRRRQRV